MANFKDAADLGQMAIRLGLLTESQLREAFAEISAAAPPSELIDLLVRKGFLTPYQAQKLQRGDTDGYFMGGYRLLYKFASGSFGRVWRGDDPRTGIPV